MIEELFYKSKCFQKIFLDTKKYIVSEGRGACDRPPRVRVGGAGELGGGVRQAQVRRRLHQRGELQGVDRQEHEVQLDSIYHPQCIFNMYIIL